MDQDAQIAALVARIATGRPTHEQVEAGDGFASKLADALKAQNYVELATHSMCKVATFERTLGNGVTEVEILSSHLFGAFTDVTVRAQTHQPATPPKKKRTKRSTP